MDFINFDDVKLFLKNFCPDVSKGSNGFTIIPIFGAISCGKFGFVDNDINGYLEIPNSMLGTHEYFILNAKGDSMIDAEIYDGDLIIVQKQPVAEDGDIAVIMDNCEVILKRFYKLPREKKYLLHPENDSYEDIIVDNCNILGIAVKIIKKLK